ncbi:hypothetical protein DY037_01475 [Apilactobacillus micheneri]|uniref:hypothetical protein n=1 Tax=Apilactobacillus micheneri TaxID=1899430 RepID=UPI0011297F9E|nr:hypothetical protein [Apilactobacillus micheneri]TPR39116.1 hypothetical protein DY119_05495 [Apilactobacillus micheneri]TPR50647.1 hypothetical protein DY037_01475 [Apilactobacillus micheneri]
MKQNIFNIYSKIQSISVLQKAIIISIFQIICLIIELKTNTFTLKYTICIAIFLIAMNVNNVYKAKKGYIIKRIPNVFYWGILMILAIIQLIIYAIFF